jgi:hypothetical protein
MKTRTTAVLAALGLVTAGTAYAQGTTSSPEVTQSQSGTTVYSGGADASSSPSMSGGQSSADASSSPTLSTGQSGTGATTSSSPASNQGGVSSSGQAQPVGQALGQGPASTTGDVPVGTKKPAVGDGATAPAQPSK